MTSLQKRHAMSFELGIRRFCKALYDDDLCLVALNEQQI